MEHFTVLSEEETRKQKIDQRLSEAGWSREKGNLLEEYYISGTKLVRDALEEKPLLSPGSSFSTNRQSRQRRFADYVLLGGDQKPLAILEAKCDQRSPLEGMEQAAEYATSLYETYQRRPFIFLSNGDEIYFWEWDRYPPRVVHGFHTQRDLEDLLSLRLYGQPLHLFQPDPA